MILSSGDRFGDYTVVSLLGKGGMGAVFLLQAADVSGNSFAGLSQVFWSNVEMR